MANSLYVRAIIGLIGAGWMGRAHTTAFHNAKMIFGDDMPVFEMVSDVNEVQKLADEECLKYKTGDKAVLLQTKSFDCKIFVPSRANFKCETNNKISE